MKKIDPKIELEDIEKMIYETLNLSKDEWFTSLTKREKLHSVENMEIEIKNSKTGETLSFTFRNNYLIAPQLTQAQQLALYQKYLEKVDPEEAKKIKEEAHKKVQPLENYISFLKYHDLMDLESACIIPVPHEMVKNIFGKTIKLIPNNSKIEYEKIKPGDLCTIQNDIVLGEFSFAKNRPALILNIDLDSKKALICFLTTSDSNLSKDKNSLIQFNKNSFYPEFLKDSGNKDSYIKCATFSEISIDRIIDKVGEVESKIEFSEYLNKIYKYVGTKLKEGIKNFEEIQNATTTDDTKIKGTTTELANTEDESKSTKILNTSTSTTTTTNNTQTTFFKPLTDKEIEKTFKTYFLNCYGNTQLDFSKFPLSVFIDEVESEILQKLNSMTDKERGYKISNTTNSISLEEVIDNRGNAKTNCYTLKINQGIKNQKLFPYKEYEINAFNVKRKSAYTTHDKLLTQVLNSVCQGNDPSYYMHYAGFIVVMAKKSHISEEQLKLNLEHSGIIYKGQLEDIFKLDLNFFKNLCCDSQYYNYQNSDNEK